MAINKIEVPKSKKYPKGIAWEVSIDRKALRIKRKFEKRSDAEDLHDALMAKIRRKDYDPDAHQPVPLKKLILAHLDYVRTRPKYNRIETVLNSFLHLTEKRRGGNVSVQSLKKADLMAYIKKRLAEKVSNQTINREMNEIKAALNAGGLHYADLDEYRCPTIARLPEPEGRPKPQWEEGEAEAILNALLAPPLKTESSMVVLQRRKLADLFVVCLLTGLRAGEARNLHCSQIDFPKKEMHITSTKGKGGKPRTRAVPFNKVVFDILWRRAEQGEWIFSNPTGDKPMTDPYTLFRTACERAEVPYGMHVGKIINGSRHTFATRALKEYGHDAQTVGALLGHSVETMVRNYLQIKSDQVRAVVESRSGENFGAILGRQVEATEVTEAEFSQGTVAEDVKNQAFTADTGT